MTALRDKFLALSGSLKAQFLDRERVIEGLIVAMLARQHVLLLGPPGTAKSNLSEALCGSLTGAQFFQTLFGRYTVPEDIYGPISFSGLKSDRFERVTSGKLPTAHVAFLDEIFKSGGGILNTMLKILNERRFDNGDTQIQCPLQLAVGASNELPDGGATGELGALFDRFVLRYWVEPLKSDADFVALLSSDTPACCEITISLEELAAAQAEVDAVKMPMAAATKCAQLRRELGTKGIGASDRRWKQCVSVLKANAWLTGDTEVTEDVFTVLADCLWDTPDQRRPLAEVVQKMVGAQTAEAIKIHDSIMDLIRQLPGKDYADRAAAVTKVAREAKRAEGDLDRLKDEATSEANRNAIGKLRTQLSRAVEPLRRETMQALGLAPTTR